MYLLLLRITLFITSFDSLHVVADVFVALPYRWQKDFVKVCPVERSLCSHFKCTTFLHVDFNGDFYKNSEPNLPFVRRKTRHVYAGKKEIRHARKHLKHVHVFIEFE